MIVVNTCGFVEQAKKDSIDTVLAAADVAGAKVVAVGCLAERYGKELADSLPEADAVLGFDDYPELAERLADVLGGHAPAAHTPVRPAHPAAAHPGRPSAADVARARPRLDPAHAALGRARSPTSSSPRAATGAARSARSRPSAARSCPAPPDDVVAEAAWLGMQGVRELVLVSENSTSYGKDLPGGTRALVRLLPRLTHVPGIDRVRVSYLQPAEMRPDLHRGHRDHARRRPVLRPVVPARQPDGAAPDAPLRLAARTSSTSAPASARSRRRRASAAT